MLNLHFKIQAHKHCVKTPSLLEKEKEEKGTGYFFLQKVACPLFLFSPFSVSFFTNIS